MQLRFLKRREIFDTRTSLIYAIPGTYSEIIPIVLSHVSTS